MDLWNATSIGIAVDTSRLMTAVGILINISFLSSPFLCLQMDAETNWLYFVLIIHFGRSLSSVLLTNLPYSISTALISRTTATIKWFL